MSRITRINLATDSIEDNNATPVTSNAVYDAIQDIEGKENTRTSIVNDFNVTYMKKYFDNTIINNELYTSIENLISASYPSNTIVNKDIGESYIILGGSECSIQAPSNDNFILLTQESNQNVIQIRNDNSTMTTTYTGNITVINGKINFIKYGDEPFSLDLNTTEIDFTNLYTVNNSVSIKALVPLNRESGSFFKYLYNTVNNHTIKEGVLYLVNDKIGYNKYTYDVDTSSMVFLGATTVNVESLEARIAYLEEEWELLYENMIDE